ncbi:cyclin-like protein [Pleomassaria siparia CBS 279.74]|uniref:RNA polymerase II holoenzyme cyclin-like subunit n=1 Tax=Pleomassaria siparia CBS 279.74 TaxID=1314801 RepID=A0A6G1KPU2_9PLEO|nr:cyclin-like protein [Pleomassaria siparia CBS 279.74]
MKLTEDDIYRSSTQYRNWSFTPAQLTAQRLKTNQQASERVKAAVARQRAQRARQSQLDSANTSESERNEVVCLTPEEELKLVDTFCDVAQKLGDFCNYPAEITATCIQFVRRFYLFNSPMTYEGQNITRTAMFIANKAESHFLDVEVFSSQCGKNSTAEKILAPEYLIIQALRYNLDVKHPFRALKGGHLELVELARGNLATLPNASQTATELQNEMLQLPRKAGGPAVKMTGPELEKRLGEAYGFAAYILKTAALLTDSYFLYTPSQIWLAAHLLADEPVTLFYLSTKIPPSHPTYSKLVTTIRACATLISSHRSYRSDRSSAEEKDIRDQQAREEIKALVKKLRQCRDPDKVDLVKLNQAQKRDAVHEGGLEENKAKRRKLQREGYEKEADGFWGPDIAKNGGGK